ncbi:hypothetical protein CYMTET_45299 [Cymbomonas tetramitiformis]|uniref:GST C-terminal domain-containing protein n=1 Tax=Cymbomonas tetramitiformis TaxID=36881 RepID=A0AAE0BYH6_9CHLO|nr:hypothetical protein CYMTET_45299 [Cymbomonas tetramitiformis]
MNDEDKYVVDVNGGGQGRKVQRMFYESIISNKGVPNESILQSVKNLCSALQPVEDIYGQTDFLVGNSISLADIAFWCDIERLVLCGFPVGKSLPNLFRVFNQLLDALPPAAKRPQARGALKAYNRIVSPYRYLRGKRLADFVKAVEKQRDMVSGPIRAWEEKP